MLTSYNKGKNAEQACCDFLQKQGLKLVARNYRGQRGEIDLVMQDKQVVVFVEVRFRKNDYYGGGLESVTRQKRERILATAEQYMQQETGIKVGRIDVVAMSQKPQYETIDDTDSEYKFEWIQDAF